MDFGFYKRARGIKHKVAMPFYPRKPAQVAVAPATAPAQQPPGSKAKQPAAATTDVVDAGTAAVNGVAPGGGSDADVDRLATLYISRVQERLRRERMADDWRKYY
ncbi:hypothetical protein SEVIR_7G080000v4 [Setaria viridis]|uniref:Uncharacterized protein n=1 Tax=Setaria viridis TaxID=4556 RepID=A0A4U6TRF9_SETVI|nr:hypothetical protein SEVIR_7G080000v2 [Setaria viridis]